MCWKTLQKTSRRKLLGADRPFFAGAGVTDHRSGIRKHSIAVATMVDPTAPAEATPAPAPPPSPHVAPPRDSNKPAAEAIPTIPEDAPMEGGEELESEKDASAASASSLTSHAVRVCRWPLEAVFLIRQPKSIRVVLS